MLRAAICDGLSFDPLSFCQVFALADVLREMGSGIIQSGGGREAEIHVLLGLRQPLVTRDRQAVPAVAVPG